MRYSPLLILTTALTLAGCSFLGTTTNTVGTALNGITDATGATTDASVTESTPSDYARAEAYVASQMPLIRRDAAAGGGESLDALATLLNEPDRDAFGRWIQAHYEDLFRDLEQPQALVARIAERRG